MIKHATKNNYNVEKSLKNCKLSNECILLKKDIDKNFNILLSALNEKEKLLCKNVFNSLEKLYLEMLEIYYSEGFKKGLLLG